MPVRAYQSVAQRNELVPLIVPKTIDPGQEALPSDHGQAAQSCFQVTEEGIILWVAGHVEGVGR